MLIDLSYMGLITIDPAQYKTTLVVAIDAPDEQPTCGVFAGRHYPFEKSEEEKPVHLFKDEEWGLKLFILDRPETKATEHQSLRWNYAAIGWDNGVYVSHPYSYELTLEELGPWPNGEQSISWNVYVSGPRAQFRLVLPDYQPGALLRGVKE